MKVTKIMESLATPPDNYLWLKLDRFGRKLGLYKNKYENFWVKVNEYIGKMVESELEPEDKSKIWVKLKNNKIIDLLEYKDESWSSILPIPEQSVCEDPLIPILREKQNSSEILNLSVDVANVTKNFDHTVTLTIPITEDTSGYYFKYLLDQMIGSNYIYSGYYLDKEEKTFYPIKQIIGSDSSEQSTEETLSCIYGIKLEDSSIFNLFSWNGGEIEYIITDYDLRVNCLNLQINFSEMGLDE